jgi:hypothetical protein
VNKWGRGIGHRYTSWYFVRLQGLDSKSPAPMPTIRSAEMCVRLDFTPIAF